MSNGKLQFYEYSIGIIVTFEKKCFEKIKIIDSALKAILINIITIIHDKNH